MKKDSLYNLLSLLLVLLFAVSCESSDKKENPYGLKVVSDVSAYQKIIQRDTEKQLLDLEEAVPGIILDIRYATKNNFTGRQIYESPKAFARKAVADSLLKIQKELNTQGLGLKVFDAYRPYAATVKFYEIYGDSTFVASPWTGSVHNTGCAVDLTLINLKSGKELSMPTAFDDFSDKAAHTYSDLPDTILKNRHLLKSIMKKYGFMEYDPEWWHYSYVNYKDYNYLAIPIRDLLK